jgi:hypothetical protein
MKRIAVLLFLAVLACVAGAYALFSSQHSASADPAPVLTDSVNIGDTTSEAGHTLLGWSDIWSGCGWCSEDNNMRLIWGNGGESCDPPFKWASLTLDAGTLGAKTLTIRHLDGATDDGFNVFVNGNLMGTYVDAYPSNTWVTTDFNITGGPYTGVLTIRLEATASAWPLCATYGQVAASWMQLYGEPIPADVAITSQSFVSPPSQIDVSADVPVTLRKVLHNWGPNPGSVLTDITKTASAPADCTIVPAGVSEQIPLPESVDVTLDETFTIHCSKPSQHGPFVITNEIMPHDPQIVDPNLANNVTSTSLTVDAIGTADVKIKDQELTGTYTYGAGSLTTADMNAWGGVSALTLPDKFNVDGSGSLTMTVYGLDMSQIGYGGAWGWPPTPDDLGAIAVAGMSGSTSVSFDRPNGAWMQLHSAIPDGGAMTWNGQGPYDNDDGYRKYLVQTWHRGLTGGKVDLGDINNLQYNVEGGGGQSDYETFDLRVVLTPTGNLNEYVMRNYIRMHNSWSWDNNNHLAGWGCPWNAAINDATSGTADNLWDHTCTGAGPGQTGTVDGPWVLTCDGAPCIAAHDHRTMTNLDLSAAYPFIEIANWGTTQTQLHTITWDSVVVEGLKAEVKVSEDVPITLEKVLHNNGEFGPVDVEVATVIDRVNIGKLEGQAGLPCPAPPYPPYPTVALSLEEAAHAATGWGPTVEPECTNGNYGGGSDDGTSRLLWHPGEPLGGDDTERSASVTLNSDSLKPHTLRLNVLDGLAGMPIPDDSFEVYVNGTLVYTYLGSNPVTAETWVVHNIDLFSPGASSRQPVIPNSNAIPGAAIAPASTLVVEIKSIGQKWPHFNPYGQLAVSWIELLANSPTQVPLPVGEDVPVEEQLVIHCWEPSTHTLTITNEVLTVEGLHMVDPDLTNNSMSSDLTVDCVTQTDVKILSQGFLNPPSSIPVSENVPVTLRKVLHNNGPFGPVEVSVDADALTVPTDCTATPAPGNPTSATLPLGTDTVVDEVWSIHCDNPSSHTFTFTDTIAVTTPHVTDSDPSNNSASANLTVAAIAKADVKITDQHFVDPPLEVNVSEDVPITLEKTLHNNGPYPGPVEVEVAAVLDSVNIGYNGAATPCNAPLSPAEAAHAATGWGPSIERACTGGNYGGGSDDSNSRLVWHWNEAEGGSEAERTASVTLNSDGLKPGILRLNVLDGMAGVPIPDDSFEVRVNGTLVYTYDGSDPVTGETWVVHSIDLFNPAASSRSPVIAGSSITPGDPIDPASTLVVEIKSTGTKWQWFMPYGQLAVSWVELLAGNPIQVTIPGSDPVTVDEPLVIHCWEPSTHTFTVTNKILKIEGEHVVDPDLTNNSATTNLTVDCIAGADVEIVSQSFDSPPASIDVNTNVLVTLNKELKNNGAFAVTVPVTKTAHAPADCTINPPTQGEDVALGAGETKTVSEDFTIRCSQPSEHTFTVDNVVGQPKEEHIVDPDEGNNVDSTELTVDAMATANVQIASQALVSSPSQIDVGASVAVTLRKHLHNIGPYGPVQVSITPSAVAPLDCTATPAQGNPTSATLPLPVSVDTVVDEGWTIQCTKASTHTFTFNDAIAVTTPHVSDPNTGNNSAQTTLTVAAIGKVDVKIVSISVPPDISAEANVETTVPLSAVIHNNGPYGPVSTHIWLTFDPAPGCRLWVQIPPYPRIEVHSGDVIESPIHHSLAVSDPLLTVGLNVIGLCERAADYMFSGCAEIVVDGGQPHILETDSTNNKACADHQVGVFGHSDLKVAAQYFENPPVQIPVSQSVVVTLDKVLHNNGPYGPVDAKTTTTIIVPSGCTASPNPHVQLFWNIPVSVDVLHHEPFTIHCSQLGPHTFTFDDGVEVTSYNVDDPDASNNAWTTDLTVTGVAAADIKITSETFVDPPTKIPQGQDTDVTLRKVIHNNGPREPVDIAINSTATAPTGCTIVPKSGPSSLTGVPVSVDQVVNEVWTIRCTVVGLKTWVFNNSIGVTTPDVADPNLDNNTVQKFLTVRDPAYPYWGDEVCDGKDNNGDTVIDEGWDMNDNTIPDCLDPALDTDRDDLKNDVDLDDDGDGWSDAAEAFMRTDPLSACPIDRLHDAWPPDINNDRVVNILDVSMFRSPLRGAYDRRYDLKADTKINILDVSTFRSVIGKSCTP